MGIDKESNAIKEGNINIREASSLFNIPRTTLRNKITEKRPIVPMVRTILTSEEEEEICNWMTVSSSRGCGMTKHDVAVHVQQLLQASKRENPFTNGEPGPSWFRNFLERHPNVEFKKKTELPEHRVKPAPADENDAEMDIDIKPDIMKLCEMNATDDMSSPSSTVLSSQLDLITTAFPFPKSPQGSCHTPCATEDISFAVDQLIDFIILSGWSPYDMHHVRRRQWGNIQPKPEEEKYKQYLDFYYRVVPPPNFETTLKQCQCLETAQKTLPKSCMRRHQTEKKVQTIFTNRKHLKKIRKSERGMIGKKRLNGKEKKIN